MESNSSLASRTEPRLMLGACIFDPTAHTLTDSSGVDVSLRDQSLRVLEYLAQHQGEVVSKQALVDAVWSGVAVTDDSLVQCISDIRTALADTNRSLVRTIVGRGYCLNAVLESAVNPGNRPRVLVSKLKANNESQDGIELAEVIAEQLVIDLSPRSGLIVMTDESRRPEAQYIIEGRTSTYRGKLRVYIQIQKTTMADNIFANTWTAELDEVEDLPNLISKEVTSTFRVHLIAFGGEEFAESNNTKLSVQDLLAKAAYHMGRFSLQNWQEARATLELAVERAPQNPVALAMLATMATQMTPQTPFVCIPDNTQHVLSLADRAVELGPQNDFVLRTRGNLKLWLLKDHAGCWADCERSLKINPTFHLTHLTLATSEILSGQPKAGLQRMQKMMSQAVGEPQYPLFMSLIALAHIFMGHSAEAFDAAREGHERVPKMSWNSLVYAVTAAGRSDITDSQEFRDMLDDISLPFSHFRDMPFTNITEVEMLEARMRSIGFFGAPG